MDVLGGTPRGNDLQTPPPVPGIPSDGSGQEVGCAEGSLHVHRESWEILELTPKAEPQGHGPPSSSLGDSEIPACRLH